MSVDVLQAKVSAARRAAILSVVTTVMTLVIFVGGFATFFWYMEGWSMLNSVYFCIVTASTVGYGDMTPSRWESRVATVIFIAVSISFVFANFSAMLTSIGDLAAQKVQLLLAKDVASTSPQVSSSPTAMGSAIIFYTKGMIGWFLIYGCAHTLRPNS